MSERRHQVLTKNHYDLFEVSSAFQKSVRRGEEKEAMFWAIELMESGYEKYLWKRMFVIMSEDIGHADPFMPVKITALKQSYDFLQKEYPNRISRRHPLFQAILGLIHSPKSRYNDLALVVYPALHKKHAGPGGKQVPDWAFDMHTRRGKMMKRGLDHFYEEGAKVHPHKPMSREAEMEKMARKIDSGDESSIDDWPVNDKGKEAPRDTKIDFDEKG